MEYSKHHSLSLLIFVTMDRQYATNPDRHQPDSVRFYFWLINPNPVGHRQSNPDPAICNTSESGSNFGFRKIRVRIRRSQYSVIEISVRRQLPEQIWL